MFLTYFGMETDLIFNHGVDLPGFAAYPLVESDEGLATLRRYFDQLVGLARRTGVGAVLETPTWVGNRDRGAEIGYDPTRLRELNRAGADLISEVRAANSDVVTVLSCSIGPRNDAYSAETSMTIEEARRYHSEQIGWVVDCGLDMIGAYTLASVEEAAGIALAAADAALPVVIGFTVETDGRLPTGSNLQEAIRVVDDATSGAVAFYVVNCAHPDHFTNVLTNDPWVERVGGVIANASRRSHQELDNAEELDDGDPAELGQLVGGVRVRHPHMRVFGGCCGTDIRHMSEIAQSVA